MKELAFRLFLVWRLWMNVSDAAASKGKGEDPLLPGVRRAEVWNSEWPSTFHDKLLTGFSPLKCGTRL